MNPTPVKIFLDANVLITVLNREYPLYPLASRILSLCENQRYLVYTSLACLAIAFYFSEIAVMNCEEFLLSLIARQ